MQKTFTFLVNALERHCHYNEATIENLFLPLIKDLAKRQREKGSRLIVFLAAPPAVGKTTLSLLFERLSKNDTPIQALSLDGFHYRQAFLKAHTVAIGTKTVPMTAVKGSPETYDIEQLKEKLALLARAPVEWPIYDRKLHDVAAETITADHEIVLIEGNWLLLDEEPWSSLKEFADYTIFISAPENVLKPRLIERKVLGGLTIQEAESFYETSDSANVRRVLDRRLTADLTLAMTENEDYILEEEKHHGK